MPSDSTLDLPTLLGAVAASSCFHTNEPDNQALLDNIISTIKQQSLIPTAAPGAAVVSAPCTPAAMVSAIKAAHSAVLGSTEWDLSSYACESGYASVGITPVPYGLPVGAFLKQQGRIWEVIYGPTEGICLGQPPTGSCEGFKQPIPLSLQQSLGSLSRAGELPELYIHNGYELGSLSGYPNLPAFIGLNNVDGLSGLDWTQVNPDSASATGQLNLNNCKPDCASSTSFSTIQIRLRASHPEQCNVTFYTQGNNGPQQEMADVFDQLQVTAVNETPLPSWLTGPSPQDLPLACG